MDVPMVTKLSINGMMSQSCPSLKTPGISGIAGNTVAGKLYMHILCNYVHMYRCA